MRNNAVFQTTNRCTYRCTICPYADIHQPEPEVCMSIDRYTTILTRLRSSEPCTTIGFGFNYDPLTDQQLAERCAIARAFKFGPLFLQTIGIHHAEHLDALLSDNAIDQLVLSIPGGNRCEEIAGIPFSTMISNVRRRAEQCAQQNIRMSVKVTAFDIPAAVACIDTELPPSNYMVYYANICTRLGKVAGTSKSINAQYIGDQRTRILPDQCSRYEQNIYINVDGSVSLCCQDWGKQLIIGNLVTDAVINKNRESQVFESIVSTKCRRCFNEVLLENPHAWT